MKQKSLSGFLIFKSPFKSPCFLMRCSTIQQTGRRSWQSILRWKPKDVNCLPAILYMIHLPPVRDARPPPGRRGCCQEEIVHSSFQPLDFTPLSQESLLWHPEHTWSYQGSGEGPNRGETDTYLRQTHTSRSFKMYMDIWLIQVQFMSPYLRADLTGPRITLGSSCSRGSRTLPSSGITGRKGNCCTEDL